VVLRTHAVRESDLVIVLLTAKFGKIDAIGRGARRSKTRFPGGLPVGARGEARIGGSGKRHSTMARLDGFQHSVSLLSLGRDLELYAYTNYLCELCDHLVTGTEPDPRIFASLCVALETAMIRTEPGVLRGFELELMLGLGHLPALDSCAVCGNSELGSTTVAFEQQRGGRVCAHHGTSESSVYPRMVLDLGHRLARREEGAAKELAVAPADVRRSLRDLCRDLLRPHLRRRLRSIDFFAQISALPPRAG